MAPRRVLPFLLLGVLLQFAVAPVASAQSVSIGVYTDGTWWPGPVVPACGLIPLETHFYSFDVRIVHTVAPVRTLRFKIVPSCPVTPMSAFEFDWTMNRCIGDGELIVRIAFFGQPCDQPNGLWFDIVPFTGDTEIRLTDCDGYPMTGRDAFQRTDSDYPCDDVSLPLAPYRPDPPDGATGVPINTMLSYVGPANVIFFSDQPLGPHDTGPILCATQPYPFYNAPPCDYPVSPGLLQPLTTYYWKAWNVPWNSIGPTATSEVFSFTTAGAVAAENSTWGRVKALYRN